MASTTFIDNQTTIYAAWLNDVNNAVYNGTFPNGSLSLTTLAVSGTVSGAGFTSLINNTLSAPGAIGGATPNTGAFTTLSATAVTATSITGLTTPLTRAQGGTGLSAAGTSGYILTSDGTNWISAATKYIGIGQTWQTVTRVSGTTYTNTTGKPIQFFVFSNTATSLTMVIDGLTFPGVGFNSGNNPTCYYIIPAGSTYSFTLVGTLTAIELR